MFEHNNWVFVLVSETFRIMKHVGVTIARGHYVAFVRPDGVNWFQMDDETASPVVPSAHEDARHSQACGVFYTQAVPYMRTPAGTSVSLQ